MSAHSSTGSGSSAIRSVAAAVLALACLAAFGAARAAAEATVPDRPTAAPAEGDDVSAAVSVLQEDDVYSASAGMDYRARMAWTSTGEVRQGKRVVGARGQGGFTANVNATYPAGDTCGFTTHFLAASGDVSESTDLAFRFVPKDFARPRRGLKAWFVQMPGAAWRGELTTVKPELCGGTTTEEGGSRFAAHAYAGGTLAGGGFPMAAPSVTVTKKGDVVVSGSAVYAAGTSSRQVVTFAIRCSSAAACFGRPPSRPNDLQIGWKFQGAACVPGPGGTFRLRVKMRMIVDNGDASLIRTTWASGMRAGARLETTTPGFQFTRQWREASAGGFVTNTRYVRDFTILTDNVSAGADWRLRLRYVWEVTSARDITKEFASPVGVSCAGGA